MHRVKFPHLFDDIAEMVRPLRIDGALDRRIGLEALEQSLGLRFQIAQRGVVAG
jgi:hypothetical protein